MCQAAPGWRPSYLCHRFAVGRPAAIGRTAFESRQVRPLLAQLLPLHLRSAVPGPRKPDSDTPACEITPALLKPGTEAGNTAADRCGRWASPTPAELFSRGLSRSTLLPW